MDKSKFLLPLFFILTFSCAEEDAFIKDYDLYPEDISTFSTVNSFGNEALTTVPSTLDPVQFEKFMQWTSYITAQTIMSDQNIRIEIIDLLDGRESIRFSELLRDLRPDNSGSDNSLFADKFIQVLRDIISNHTINRGPGPNHASQTPPEPILECGCGGPFDVADWVNLYIGSLLNTNCLELYLPNGLRTVTGSNSYSLTSTAHPLTNDSSNYGIVHYSEPVAGFISDRVIVEMNYLLTVSYDHVLVVRPYRTLQSCTYQNYAGINFIDFLN